ncbi:MAG: hypothetical protein H6538_03165 [Bacteroidales bacterium]|nr:hypothetical protein [Bacteroidales bacterium]MCB9013360.1 hypothetical protein [Bacteroidales bacterium]
MKKSLLIIGLIIILASCAKEMSDLQTQYFVRFYGAALDDTGSDVGLTADGGYVFAGTSQNDAGNTDIILVTTDKYGFQTSDPVFYGGDGNESASAILVLNDGYVVTGSSILDGIETFLLVKFGLDGSVLWTSPYVIEGRGNDLIALNNQIEVVGYSIVSNVKRVFSCVFDESGNKVDLDPAQGSPGEYYTSVVLKDNKPFKFGTDPSTNSIVIIKPASGPNPLTSAGNGLSSKIILSQDGGFFIVGTSNPVGSGFKQIIVKKLNNDDLLTDNLSFNTNPIGSDADFRGVDIVEMEDGTVAVLGDKTLSKDTDIVLYFLNPDGTLRSSKIYGKTGNQSASSLKISSDGGLIILGSNQQEKTNSMITLIKTDSEGNIWE